MLHRTQQPLVLWALIGHVTRYLMGPDPEPRSDSIRTEKALGVCNTGYTQSFDEPIDEAYIIAEEELLSRRFNVVV
jgi:hypothetical protein